MSQHRPQRGRPSLLAWLLHAVRLLRNYALHKGRARSASHELAEHARPASVQAELVRELFAALQPVNAGAAGSAPSGPGTPQVESGAAYGAPEDDAIRLPDDGQTASITEGNASNEASNASNEANNAPNVASNSANAASNAPYVASNAGNESSARAEEAAYRPAAAMLSDQQVASAAEPAANPATGAASSKQPTDQASAKAAIAALTEQERALVHRIHHETEVANRNNVTRTEAYRAVYYRSPELQWALLAHLVSRNGGWNMTDLQGDLLPELLDDENRRHTFILLERINSLIFHDAYPQLLLYEASRKEGRDLSRLLPYFGVSRFMSPVWAQFWQRGDSILLTTALIVNEQHVIEKPIVQSEYFKAHVLKRAPFLLQIPLQTNTVVMPYGSPLDAGGEMMLAGLVLEHFNNVAERIEFGKRLYAILLCVPEVMDGVMAFVRGVHHTGSRADYAPHLFTKEHRPEREDAAYEERLEGCSLIAGAKKLLSPVLAAAWADVPSELPERTDWLEDPDALLPYFASLPLPEIFEVTFEHCMAFNKLELAVQAKQRFGSHGKRR